MTIDFREAVYQSLLMAVVGAVSSVVKEHPKGDEAHIEQIMRFLPQAFKEYTALKALKTAEPLIQARMAKGSDLSIFDICLLFGEADDNNYLKVVGDILDPALWKAMRGIPKVLRHPERFPADMNDARFSYMANLVTINLLRPLIGEEEYELATAACRMSIEGGADHTRTYQLLESVCVEMSSSRTVH